MIQEHLGRCSENVRFLRGNTGSCRVTVLAVATITTTGNKQSSQLGANSLRKQRQVHNHVSQMMQEHLGRCRENVHFLPGNTGSCGVTVLAVATIITTGNKQSSQLGTNSSKMRQKCGIT